MNLIAPPRRFDPDCPEMMDRPGLDAALLAEELRILEQMNRRWGGHRLVLHYVERFVGGFERGAPLSILDLGTGSADIPRAIAAWAKRRQLQVAITAVDSNPEILRLAREATRDWPEIQFQQYDIRALPCAEGSFDLVLCSLALHHFSTRDAMLILRRIGALARRGYIVNDLLRNWPAIWMAELLARIMVRSPAFRNDAPQSCRAAFTVCELRAMAEEAGLSHFRIKRHHAFFRMVLEGKKQ